MSRPTAFTNPTEKPWSNINAAKSFNDRFNTLLSMHDDGTETRPPYLPAGGMWACTSVGVRKIYQFDGTRDVLLWEMDAAGKLKVHTPLADEDTDGLARRATDLMAVEGADNSRFVTPKQQKEALERLEESLAVQNKSGGEIRNLILAGREKDGLPAYIATHEFLNMEHELRKPVGAKGSVSASSNYSTDYDCTRPLLNQVVPSGTYFWGTTSGVKSGWWQYDFTTPRVLTGMFYTSNNVEYSPGVFQVQGKKTQSSEWEDLYRMDVKKRINGTSGIGKEHGRTLWFTQNTTAYSSVRINVESAAGTGIHLDIRAIRFFEAVAPNLHKYDAVLAASPKQPFTASIACGSGGDHAVHLERNVVIDGHLLAEMSRNHMYLVPEKPDGSCPDYVQAGNSVYLPEAQAYLARDLRKVNYGSEEALRKQTLALLQCRETEDKALTGVFPMNQSDIEYPIQITAAQASTAEAWRGAPSSFGLLTGSSWISPNKDLTTGFKDKIAQASPGSRDFTVTLDAKYAGPALEAEDTYRVLWDSGYYTGGGAALAYYHRRGQFAIYINGNWSYAWPYVFDGGWHTISLSKRADKIYLHVDGKCLGGYNACPPIKSHYNYWLIGRWIHTDGYHWRGYLNNFRYVIGDCLYQSEDYTVSPAFQLSGIPDKTLWWNSRKGTVQEWQAEAEIWKDTPMLPIGHIDTGWKEHLHSEEPRGTQRDYDLLAVKTFSTSGQYSASYPPKGILNFASGGNGIWLTPTNNATVEHWVCLELEKPTVIEEVRITSTGADASLYSYPAIFRWEGSQDGNTWTRLADRTAFVRDGIPNMEITHVLGSGHNIQGLKRFAYDNATPFRFYRFVAPPKGAIPYFSAIGYTSCRLQLTLRGAKSEITGCTSYVIGDTFTYGPVMLATNTEYTFPVPFGGAEFEVGGYVVEKNDWQSKKRKLGQAVSYYTTAHYGYGELVYASENSVTVVAGSYALSLFIGSAHNSLSANVFSTQADLTLICRRTM